GNQKPAEAAGDEPEAGSPQYTRHGEMPLRVPLLSSYIPSAIPLGRASPSRKGLAELLSAELSVPLLHCLSVLRISQSRRLYRRAGLGKLTARREWRAFRFKKSGRGSCGYVYFLVVSSGSASMVTSTGAPGLR